LIPAHDELQSPCGPEYSIARARGGALWGERASRFIDDDRLAIVERLIEWTQAQGHSLLDLATGWHTSHPLVASVIAGATKAEQIDANVAAASWALTAEDRAEVDLVIAG